MSSKPTEPRSIASQLVLLFTPAAALLLLCGLAVLYWIVIRHAFEEDNAVLADKLAAVRADLGESNGPQALVKELSAARAKRDADYLIRLLELDGRTVAETPGMQDLLPSSCFPATTAPRRKPVDVRIHGKLFALATATGEAAGQPYIIQLAQDRSGDDRFRKEFGLLTLAVLAAGIAGSALLASTVTKRGLRPLSEMTTAFERTGPAHLTDRIEPERWPRELRPLACAFDEMLVRLDESFTRLSQFSADLAHELRTPVANMLGEAQVALTRERTPAEYRETIESSVAECERLSAIVDNLLFLARAEAANPQVDRQQFDGRDAIEKIASYYQPAADERHVTIESEGAAEIYADPMLFNRAATNLLDNALRFTPDGGKIVVSVRARDGFVDLTVRDNGTGISAEHLPRIFDRFYRVDAARSSAGSGLGLSLVRSIAELHGGTASASSLPGEGTAVTVSFPA